MQLVIMIIHDSDHMNSILVKMMEAGIKGGSLIDCEGALQAIGRASSDPPPVFGSLREYLNPESAAKTSYFSALWRTRRSQSQNRLQTKSPADSQSPIPALCFACRCCRTRD